MRLAAPIRNDRVSPVFDTAGRWLLLDLADGVEQGRHTVEVAQTSSPTERAKRLAELGVNVLVCGAISRPLAELRRWTGSERATGGGSHANLRV